MSAEPEDREMTFTEHLEELRRRLIVSLAALAVGTVLVCAWSGELLEWLAGPTGGLIFVAPTEAFFTRLKVSMFGGLLVSLPVILHQAWAFTACTMSTDLRRGVSRLVPVSYLLFLAGVALAVVVVVPVAIRFLIGYGSESVRPFLAVGRYVDFVGMIAIAFGAVFQLPLVLLFLHRAGIVTYEGLSSKRRYIYFAGFVVAALITPGPDVFSQMAIAIPIVVLFELSLLAMRLSSGPAS